jgi:tetratricopeptide (TPR) repeat protein
MPRPSDPGSRIPGGIPRDLETAYRANPTDARVWFNFAALAHNNGERVRAGVGFRRAVLCEPGFAAAFAQVMTAAAAESGPMKALRLAWRLACLVPTSAQNRALITQYLFELGQDRHVGPVGRMSLVLDPTAAGLYRLMALSASRLQDMPGAAILLTKALKVRPDWVDARLALAGARFALMDFEGVLRETERARESGPETGEGAMLRGRAFLALDQLEEARACFALAARLEPHRQPSIEVVSRTMNRSHFEF